MDIGSEVRASFLFQLISGIKKNRIVAGGGDLADRVFVAQILDKMPPVYEFYPSGITGYSSRDLHNARMINIHRGFISDIYLCGLFFINYMGGNPRERNYMQVIEHTKTPYPNIPRLVQQKTIDFFQQLPFEQFRWLASYLMALQLAKEESHKKGKATVKNAQERLAWPDRWIKQAQRLEQQVA